MVIITTICLTLLTGCDDSSDNVPNSQQGVGWEGIEELMTMGWNAYNDGDFTAAQDYFREANQRNALYLPAYDGLGWCAVRLTDFIDAGIQFSFITTLVDAATEPDLLADAYAGLCLSATIERMVMEISGEASQDELDALSQESINMANLTLDLKGEDYNPIDHDAGFGSDQLHLMNAQNYFYLQQFANCEEELTIVDPDFIDNQIALYGGEVIDEAVGISYDENWYLSPANPGLHYVSELSAPTFLPWAPEYEWIFGTNEITVLQPLGEYGQLVYDWVEINPDRPGSLPGIDTGIAGDDEITPPIQMGIDFPFYNDIVTEIFITSNGFGTFANISEEYIIDNLYTIPDSDSLPDFFVAAYWDDYNLDPTEGHGKVFYYYDMTDDRFIVEWDSVASADEAVDGEYYTFEMILNPNGEINFNYKAIEHGTAALFPSASVGIESIRGTFGLEVTYNGSGDLEPSTMSSIHVYRPLVEGMEFSLSYVYINDLDQYLHELINHIQSRLDL